MKTKNILIYSGLLLGGLFFGYLFFGGHSEPQSMDEHIEETHTDEQGNIVYSCSMHPHVRENEPGDCPICGMELIPVNELGEDDGLTQNPNAVQISKAAMALADIQTSEVRLEIPVQETRLPGKISVDERQIKFIPAHFHGRIEQLYVNFTGDYISKGQKIARVYSPILFTAQKELLEAYKNRSQNPELYASARQKLLNWKIPEWQIDEIITNGKPSYEFDIYAHKEGFVLKRHVTTGDHLDLGDIMFEISPLDMLWGLFDAYESDVAGLNLGDKIAFKTEAYPAVTLQGSISYIQPTLNSQSRSVSIRIEIPNTNEGLDLKPGMLINGLVSTASKGQPQILIPRSAVMWTGKRSIVFVDVTEGDNPAFEAREVVLGSRAGNDYIIESGLEAGERVVTNGTFKVDAAAQLSDKLSMMNREPGTGRGAPPMPGMDMDMNDSEMEQMEDHSEH